MLFHSTKFAVFLQFWSKQCGPLPKLTSWDVTKMYSICLFGNREYEWKFRLLYRSRCCTIPLIELLLRKEYKKLYRHYRKGCFIQLILTALSHNPFTSVHNCNVDHWRRIKVSVGFDTSTFILHFCLQNERLELRSSVLVFQIRPMTKHKMW